MASRKNTTLFRILLAAALLIIIHLATTKTEYPLVSEIYDKLNHLFAFLALAFLADFSFPGSSYNLKKILPLLACGLLLEVLQYFLPFSEFSTLDMLADLAGLMIYRACIPVVKKLPFLKGRWENIDW